MLITGYSKQNHFVDIQLSKDKHNTGNNLFILKRKDRRIKPKRRFS
jgi:hypothetical protein